MGRRRTVAVIGGGCAGVLLTRELLRCTGDDVVLIEPREPGGGVAYGLAQPWHLLNSRAGAMSADPDDPDHFVRWANATPDDFLGRRDYGRYLSGALEAATEPGHLRVIRTRAASVRPGTVSMVDGRTIRLPTTSSSRSATRRLSSRPAQLVTPATSPIRGVPARWTASRPARRCCCSAPG